MKRLFTESLQLDLHAWLPRKFLMTPETCSYNLCSSFCGSLQMFVFLISSVSPCWEWFTVFLFVCILCLCSCHLISPRELYVVRDVLKDFKKWEIECLNNSICSWTTFDDMRKIICLVCNSVWNWVMQFHYLLPTLSLQIWLIN